MSIFARRRPHESDDLQLRWMARADLPQVIQIEQACFETPWTEGEFVWWLRQQDGNGMVAVDHFGVTHGFVIYALHKHRLHIQNFAVRPESQRKGVGRLMAERLKAKLSDERRTCLEVIVRERNLPAQVFYREMGLRYCCTVRGHYSDSEDDGYFLRYVLGGQPVNRITQYMEAE